MQIRVMVKLGMRQNKVENFGNNRYLVYLESNTHQDGNLELVNLMSKYLGVPLTRIALIKGENSQDKLIEAL